MKTELVLNADTTEAVRGRWRVVKSLHLLVGALSISACTGIIDANGDAPGANGPGGNPGGMGGPGSGGSGGSGDPHDPGVAVLPGGLQLDGKPVYYRVVRLTHEQWENSVRDLLKLGSTPGLSTSFLPDPPDGTFSNNERALYVTDSLRMDYQRAAESLSEMVARDSDALARVAGTTNDALTFIREFGQRAFRRPLDANEEARYKALFDSGAELLASGDAFADGVQVVIEAMLQSPYFLYRLELTAEGKRLSSYELAQKLSFLLRNTTPDDSLLAAAQAGQLDTNDGLLATAMQMLDSPAAQTVLQRFHTELYGLDRYASIAKDKSLFPNYDESLNQTLVEADRLFFDRVYTKGLGLREILTSNVAFVNQATAGFYGVPVSSPTLTEVTLDGSRPGFLTRLGFLAYNAGLRTPDPIHRGVDINAKILCGKLAPPPGEIPALPEPIPGQTNRERVNSHTGPGTCGATCHGAIINPLGFSLENFDAIGQARTTDNGKPVDTTGQFAFSDGVKEFDDFPALVALMVENQNTHGCYASKLAEFALARDVAGGDGTLVTALQEKSLAEDFSIKDMLLATIQDPTFLVAKGGAP